MSLGVKKRFFSSGKTFDISAIYALFLLISFLGWILEEVFFSLHDHVFSDRGFLSLPICVVYGISIMGTYFLFGLPHRMRFFSFSLPVSQRRTQKLVQTLLFILLAGVVCTFCELIVGLFLYGAFGFFMWDYRGIPFHFGPYICAPFALIWGILSFLFLRYLFLRLFLFFLKVRRETLWAVLLPLSIFLILDISMNCTYSFCYRAHMALW